MIKLLDFFPRRGGYGIYMGITIWALLVGNVLAENPPPTTRTMKFGDIELELPKGLNQEDFYLPSDNPMSKDKVELGHTLFLIPGFLSIIPSHALPAILHRQLFQITAEYLWGWVWQQGTEMRPRLSTGHFPENSSGMAEHVRWKNSPNYL